MTSSTMPASTSPRPVSHLRAACRAPTASPNRNVPSVAARMVALEWSHRTRANQEDRIGQRHEAAGEAKASAGTKPRSGFSIASAGRNGAMRSLWRRSTVTPQGRRPRSRHSRRPRCNGDQHPQEREQQHGNDQTGRARPEHARTGEMADGGADRPERRTRWPAAIGRVAPRRTIGKSTSAKPSTAVVATPDANVATESNIASETMPNTAIISCVAASTGKRGARCRDSQPPAAVPIARPSRTVVTMIVTDAPLSPSIRDSGRCQVN